MSPDKKDYVSGLDLSVVENGTMEERLAFIHRHYANFLHAEFGEVPYLQMPGEPPVDNRGRGFNPEKVARYVNTYYQQGMHCNPKQDRQGQAVSHDFPLRTAPSLPACYVQEDADNMIHGMQEPNLSHGAGASRLV